MSDATLTFLGTGGSMGVPVVGCKCETCLSKNPHDKRLRSSALIEVEGKKILIDCGPDFRCQALENKIDKLDAIILTHPHYDHIGGFDDLRGLFFHRKSPLPCFLSAYTAEDVRRRFDYMFKNVEGPSLLPKMSLQEFLSERGELKICGIKVKYITYTQTGMPINGLIIGNLAYISDIKDFPKTIFEDLEGIETLVVSALRETPSLMHFTVDDAVLFAEKAGAKRTFLTHIAHELSHEKINASLPPNVQMAYDGLTIHFQIKS